MLTSINERCFSSHDMWKCSLSNLWSKKMSEQKWLSRSIWCKRPLRVHNDKSPPMWSDRNGAPCVRIRSLQAHLRSRYRSIAVAHISRTRSYRWKWKYHSLLLSLQKVPLIASRLPLLRLPLVVHLSVRLGEHLVIPAEQSIEMAFSKLDSSHPMSYRTIHRYFSNNTPKGKNLQFWSNSVKRFSKDQNKQTFQSLISFPRHSNRSSLHSCVERRLGSSTFIALFYHTWHFCHSIKTSSSAASSKITQKPQGQTCFLRISSVCFCSSKSASSLPFVFLSPAINAICWSIRSCRILKMLKLQKISLYFEINFLKPGQSYPTLESSASTSSPQKWFKNGIPKSIKISKLNIIMLSLPTKRSWLTTSNNAILISLRQYSSKCLLFSSLLLVAINF